MGYKPFRKWDIRDYDKIVKFRKEGLTWEEIGERFPNQNYQTVKHYYYRNSSTGAKSRNPNLTPAFIEEVEKLRKQKVSYTKIAEQLNTTKGAIAGCIHRHLNKSKREVLTDL